MPGSTIICQGLSSAYNSLYLVTNGDAINFRGLTIDANSGTFNVDTTIVNPFPFQTGDAVYYSFNMREATKYFAIMISSTSIKIATTKENALANIAVNLTETSSNTNISFLRHQLSNCPLSVNNYSALKMLFNENNYWQASAISLVQLSISQNFTYTFTMNMSMTGLITSNKSYAIGITSVFRDASVSKYQGLRIFQSFSQNAVEPNILLPYNPFDIQCKIICYNKTISFQVMNNNVFTTVYSANPVDIAESLQIFTYLPLNISKLSNCTLTYQ